ncbi:chaplin family protein [Streptomyces sp. NPDC058611]|uniref:chaplin family protein n=1 Tax=unclassified Streptomyces TaxID=2593676 RepID=UPI00365F4DE7
MPCCTAVTAAASAVLASGAGLAAANAVAEGAATGSPGVLQAPIHIPINICVNTVNTVNTPSTSSASSTLPSATSASTMAAASMTATTRPVTTASPDNQLLDPARPAPLPEPVAAHSPVQIGLPSCSGGGLSHDEIQ